MKRMAYVMTALVPVVIWAAADFQGVELSVGTISALTAFSVCSTTALGVDYWRGRGSAEHKE